MRQTSASAQGFLKRRKDKTFYIKNGIYSTIMCFPPVFWCMRYIGQSPSDVKYLRNSLPLFQLTWILLWLSWYIRLVTDHRCHLFICSCILYFTFVLLFIPFACIHLEPVSYLMFQQQCVFWGVCFFLTITCLRVTATILSYDFYLGNALNIILSYLYIFVSLFHLLKYVQHLIGHLEGFLLEVVIMKIVDSLLIASCHGEVGSRKKRKQLLSFEVDYRTKNNDPTVPTLLFFLRDGFFFFPLCLQ